MTGLAFSQNQNPFSTDMSRYEMGQQTTYQIYTENDPPRSFKNSQGKITGSAVDVVQELMNRLNRFEPIQIRSWQDAYTFLTRGPNTLLFSVAKTKTRTPMFRWVGPIGTSKLQMFALANTPSKGVGTDWLKSCRVATVQGWYSEGYLRDNGYANIITLKNASLTVRALLDGTVEYICLPDLSAAGAVISDKLEMSQIKKVADLEVTPLYIAFSPDVQPDVIKKWQDTLGQMEKDGFIVKNQQKWIDIYKQAVNAK